MAGVFAIIAAVLAFLVPLALPLFAQRWATLAMMVAVASLFFSWLYFDIASGTSMIGSFLGGLMLIGFAFGAIAKFAILLGRPPQP
jgi:hypothetical protein